MLVVLTISFFIVSCGNKNEKKVGFRPNTEKPANYGDSLGTIDHFISKQEAKAWIENYLKAIDTTVDREKKIPFTDCIEAYNIAAISSIQEIPGCAGFRLYKGIKPGTNTISTIIFGVDKDGNNLYLKRSNAKKSKLNMILPKIKQTGTGDVEEEGGIEYSQREPAESGTEQENAEFILRTLD